MEIAKLEPGVIAKIEELVASAGIGINIGDKFISNGQIIKIEGFDYKEGYREDCRERLLYRRATNHAGTVWSESISDDHLSSFIESVRDGKYAKLTKSVAALDAEALAIISGDADMQSYTVNEYQSVNEERAIMAKNSKESLISIQNALEVKKNSAALMALFVGREMEKRKRELDRIKDTLYGAVEVFQKQIKKIMRVITTIELYLGIEEELHQIMEGPVAPQDTPISFRQMVLFMDEEVGAHEDGGLDFRDIEKFDEWLITGENYKIIIPEEKGMVVLRPRRSNKRYGDPVLDTVYNQANRLNTYILIRNGLNFYRIYTEKLVILDRLFPKKHELQELYEKMQKESFDRDKEKIENEMYQYKKRAVLMQGLIDRSEVFHPLPVEGMSIFKLEDHDKHVRFIYDDEMQLPSGRLPFMEWKENINAKIEKGSRVLCTGYGRAKDHDDRFIKYYSSDFSMPNTPNKDIYEVEEYLEKERFELCESQFEIYQAEADKKGWEYKIVERKEKGFGAGYDGWCYRDIPLKAPITKYEDKITVLGISRKLSIMYDAGGDVWGGWGKGVSERKNRVRFIIKKRDDEILNYDQIDLDDIDFYLKSRVDRRNYLTMMPVLKEIKKMRLEEIKSEEAFADLVFRMNANQGIPEEALKLSIMEAINWWKFKNQWKRPINKDDAKALRMINKKLKNIQHGI